MTTDTDPHENIVVEELPVDEYASSSLTVDFLYLDREVCERCSGTEEALHTALDRVADVLDGLDIEVAVRKVHVEDEAAARQTELEISPTIRIDGRDIQPNYTASACESSGDLCKRDGGSGDGSFIDCREWSYRGETYSTPPVTLLVEKMLHAALVERGTIGSDVNGQYAVPENLREFFRTATPRSATSSASDEATSDSESCC